MRHLQSVEHLAAITTPPPASAGGVHTDTFLILAAVLCFLLCVVGLAVVARCSRLCNPSAFSVEAEPAEAMPPATCKGLKKKALQSLPTVSTVAFDWSDDDENPSPPPPASPAKNSNIPLPYDPFSKKPAVAEPADPTNLQEIFHRMRTEGLTDYAIKMFDGLSKDGLTHEALALFAIIKDKGAMPDVVAHTAVLEAYVNAGPAHWRDAVRTYDRMLASGVAPNAYTLAVLVKGLAASDRCAEAGKYLVEMLDRRMRPNVATYLAAFEAYVRMEKMDEGKALLETMKGKGFMPDEEAVRSGTVKRGHVFRGVMNLLFGK